MRSRVRRGGKVFVRSLLSTYLVRQAGHERVVVKGPKRQFALLEAAGTPLGTA
jgi:hypothetical protein